MPLAAAVVMTTLLAATAAGGAVAELTAEQRTRLATAYDGRDHQEEAFVALVEHARTHPDARESVPPPPLLATLIESPEPHRGRPFRLTGVLQQQRPLPRPHTGIDEWFVRNDEGQPLMVFVVDPGAVFRDGQRVQVDAWFYKRIDAVARDGRTHAYAAFVGTAPTAVSTGTSASAPPIVILVVVLPLLVIGVLIARSMARRAAGGAPGRRSVITSSRDHVIDDEDDDAPLPEDPIDALRELASRREDDSTPAPE